MAVIIVSVGQLGVKFPTSNSINTIERAEVSDNKGFEEGVATGDTIQYRLSCKASFSNNSCRDASISKSLSHNLGRLDSQLEHYARVQECVLGFRKLFICHGKGSFPEHKSFSVIFCRCVPRASIMLDLVLT